MTVGDIVSAVGATGSAVNFQPAANVEIIIFTIYGSDKDFALRGAAGISYSVTVANKIVNISNTKLCINNTNYLYMAGDGGKNRSYSGIQIK